MIFGTRKEYDKMPDYFGKKGCPFCKSDGEEEKYIVKETKLWSIRYNKFPYYGKEKHLMAIPKKHKAYTVDLDENELKDYINVEKIIKEFYKGEKNYFSFIRQGLGGRSVEHLHYHYLPGHISFDDTNQEIGFKIKNK